MSANDNDELKRSFKADGFAAIPQFFVGEELSELIDNVDRFINDVVPKMPSQQVFYENKQDPTTLKQIQKMADHDAWFHELFTTGRFPAVAQRLLDGPVVPKNIQYFSKPPRVGKPTPPHQDGYYFMLDPCEAVTMWFALDNVDEENGCVRYVRGSQKHGMREHARTETLGFSQGIIGYPSDDDYENEVAIPARPGDLIAHDAMTIHRADGNQSATRSRRALGLVYYSARAREDTAAHAAYQRQLADRMKAAGKI
jgi:phytanoyl-CoA hydroxylase